MIDKKAVALKYQQEEQNAPKVIAKGKGELALKIIQKAKKYDIPLFQNDALANSLLSLDTEQEIPPLLYKAVAEVFVWLIKSEEKAQISK
jgi:flagellar biosynthesis protein